MWHEWSISLLLKATDDLPAWATFDELRVRQVLINLVGNAIKFTDGRDVYIRVSRARSAGQTHLRFAVTDTGPGIPESDLKTIFAPFVQGEQGPRPADPAGDTDR